MRRWGELYAALVDGRTVFVTKDEAPRAIAAVRARLVNYNPNLRIRTRSAEYHDRPGALVWVDKQ